MKNLKLIAFILLIISSMNANGQTEKTKPNKQKKEAKIAKEAKINELRKKYFNEKLDLSDAEQKAFWPLYDEYKQKDKALRDSFNKKFKPNSLVFMDDKKAEEYLNAMLKLKDDQNNLLKEYIIKFKKVLPIKKVALLNHTEKEFKKSILSKVKGKNPPPGSEPPPED